MPTPPETAEQRQEREEALIERQKRIDAAYLDLFGSEPGRVVLVDLLGKCGLLERCHVPGDDSHETAWRDGRRSVALDLLEKLRWTAGELEQLSRARAAEQLSNLGVG